MARRFLRLFIRREEDFETLRRMFSENFSRYRFHYLITIFCLVLISCLTAFNAWIMGPIVKNVFLDGDSDTAFLLSIAICIAFSLKGILGYTQAVLLQRIGISLVAHYQERLFNHLTTLRVQFFNDRHSVDLIARLNHNVYAMKDMLNTIILSYARDLLTVICLIGVMLWRDTFLTITILTVGPVVMYMIGKYNRRIRNIVRGEVESNARVITGLQEVAHGIEIVKSFTMEEQLRSRMARLIQDARSRTYKIAKIMARTSPVMEFLAGLMISGTVLYGSYIVSRGSYDPGTLTSFITALLLAYDPAKRLASVRVQLEPCFVNTRMIYEILDTPRSHRYGESNVSDLSVSRGEVCFRDVSFSYDDRDHLVLDSLSFTAMAGKTTALVGPSGAGKTTIISLLQRFYDPMSGSITIDGQDISGVGTNSLRRHIAYVSQDPILFQGSIRDNLLYAKPDATDTDIKRACKMAQAHDFIMDLPDGYDTPLGENATNLSGGQRQRVAIARALVRDAPILLLDEATSSLDAESERVVQEALKALMSNRTTIVIAHRLATIENADNILAIKDGKVVESGTHSELLKKQGLYSQLQQASPKDK